MKNNISSFRSWLSWLFPSSGDGRQFKAALSNRLNSDWITSVITANQDLKNYLEKLVVRSRDLAKNNSDYIKWLDMRHRNVTYGMSLQVKSKNSDGKLDQVANSLIEDHFSEWGRKRNGFCHVSEKRSWKELLDLVDRTVAIDGECFVEIVEFADNPYLFSIKILNSLDCDINYSVQNPDGTYKILLGVELDQNEKPIAYHFKSSADYYPFRTRITADRLIHIYRKTFHGQVRGYPRASGAILDLNMLDGYKETSLVGARAAAAQMGIWEQQQGGLGAGTFNPDAKGPSSDGPHETEVAPGKILIAKKGWTFKPFTPPQPVANFGMFIKAIARSIANGLGVSYNDFANDLEGVNFSSLRGGTISERDGWKIDQEFIIESFCEIIYSRWLKMFLISGLTRLPLDKYVKFLADKWQGRRWEWVSPKDDAVANQKKMDLFVTSPQRICAEQGVDFDDVIDEIASAEEKLAPLGFTLFPFNKKNNQETDNAPETDEAQD